jgi:hypothetical protein
MNAVGGVLLRAIYMLVPPLGIIIRRLVSYES